MKTHQKDEKSKKEYCQDDKNTGLGLDIIINGTEKNNNTRQSKKTDAIVLLVDFI